MQRRTNLIPLAYYRPHARFVGIDFATTRIAAANETRDSLGLANVSFVARDFVSVSDQISEPFDFIVAHGVFSWVSHEHRDAMLTLCAERLRPGGLLYLNYNSRPGWNVRGLIREFLLAQTAHTTDLATRTEKARRIAATLAVELAGAEHPYLRLLSNEFRFVTDNDASHTAHDIWPIATMPTRGGSSSTWPRDTIWSTSRTRISTMCQAESPTNSRRQWHDWASTWTRWMTPLTCCVIDSCTRPS